MKKLKDQGVDTIVLNFHAGGQYNDAPAKRVKKYVSYLKKLGIDTIIVNHEHLVQEADLSDILKGNIVTYCLGNFLGGAGVYYGPWDKMSEYSVLLHIYIDEESMKKTYSFSICKMVNDGDEKYSVRLLYDLIQQEQDQIQKEKLKKDNMKIYNRFTNRTESAIEPQLEYLC